MEEFKGTQGKWIAHPCVMCGNYEIHIQSEEKGRSLAIIPNHNKFDKANAQLIAAAPELLHYLQILTERFGRGFNSVSDDAYIQEAKKVINKALGKEVEE